MVVVIAHNGVKRRIEGDFSICMGREDMHKLVNKLNDQLDHSDWSFGWVDIRPSMPGVAGEPLPWKEA